MTLVGLHGRADGRMQEADWQVVATARIEALKLLSMANPDDVLRARAINPSMFIIVRLFADFHRRSVNSRDFVDWLMPEIAAYFQRGVRYFEVHNEPNLVIEGLGTSWRNGMEFASWFGDVYHRIKSVFPQAQLGFPGLSPGHTMQGIRQDMVAFLVQAQEACRLADWIGAHAYWSSEAEMGSRHGGLAYLDVQERHPNKPLLVTEFSNNNRTTDKAVKGAHYVRYYESLRPAGVLAAFAFVVSGSHPDFAHETWRAEDGTLAPIAALVGARKPAPAGTHSVSASLLNVREFPWTGERVPPVAAQLNNGAPVSVHGTFRGWGCISRDGNRWVNMSYLKAQPR
jgi:hypothetical protein